MDLAAEYQRVRRDERMARVALRALLSTAIAQGHVAQELSDLHTAELLEAAIPFLEAPAVAHEYQRLAVLGSMVRGAARAKGCASNPR